MMNQITNRKKLSAAGAGVPLAMIVAFCIEEFAQVKIPAEIAAAGGALFTWVASLLIPDDMEA